MFTACPSSLDAGSRGARRWPNVDPMFQGRAGRDSLSDRGGEGPSLRETYAKATFILKEAIVAINLFQ